jgi:hypothetical protein
VTKRVKAPPQRNHAQAPAPPKRAHSSTASPAQQTNWSGNQTRLHKLASPVPEPQQNLRVGTRHPPNLFLPKTESEPQNPFSHYRGLADAVGPLTRHKNIEVLPVEDHHDRDTAKNKDIIRTFGSNANTLLAVAMEETNTLTSNYHFGDIYPRLSGPEWNPGRAVREITSGTVSLSEPKAETRSFQPDELPGGLKTGDAANFGLYKMNWLMISQTDTGKSLIEQERASQTLKIREAKQDFAPTDWNVEAAVGHRINADTALASRIMLEAMKKWHAEIAPDPRHPAKGNFWAGHRAGWTGLNDPGSADWNDILFYYDAVMAIKAKLDNDTEGKLTTGSTRIGVNVSNI